MEKRKELKNKIKSWLIWDVSDLTDPVFKSEVKANHVAAITMIGLAVVLLIGLIISFGDAFTGSMNAARTALLVSPFELLVPAGLCIAFKGRKKWLKYVLSFFSILVIWRLDMIFTYYIALFWVIPLILSCRYYSKRFTTIVGLFSIVMMFTSTLLWQYAQALPDMNIFTYRELLDVVKMDGENAVFLIPEYYTGRVLVYNLLIRLLVYLNIFNISIFSADNGKKMLDEEILISKKNASIASELELAKGIQAGMLPSIFPPFPGKKEFDIYALMNPAKEVGGDFYDFFMLDDKRIALVMADVSGKGVPAALFMVIAKTLIKNQAQSDLTPSEVLSKVNQVLMENNDLSLFVTCWLGYLNIQTGVLTYANAGHNPPVLKTDGKHDFLKGRKGFVLAGMDGLKYYNNKVTLKPGDSIFLYTDGVTEAQNNNEELFGEERLVKYLDSHQFASPKELITALRGEIDTFSDGREQFDDITMLSLNFQKYLEDSSAEHEFPASIDSLNQALDFVETELTERKVGMKEITQLRIISEEIFANVANYAYHSNLGKVRITVDSKDGEVIMRFIDRGIPFNPLLRKDPDITLGADDRDIGGLGIFMVKKMTDDIKYKYENGQNILMIKKKIKEQE